MQVKHHQPSNWVKAIQLLSSCKLLSAANTYDQLNQLLSVVQLSTVGFPYTCIKHSTVVLQKTMSYDA
jgi:hypothetical protein